MHIHASSGMDASSFSQLARMRRGGGASGASSARMRMAHRLHDDSAGSLISLQEEQAKRASFARQNRSKKRAAIALALLAALCCIGNVVLAEVEQRTAELTTATRKESDGVHTTNFGIPKIVDGFDTTNQQQQQQLLHWGSNQAQATIVEADVNNVQPRERINNPLRDVPGIPERVVFNKMETTLQRRLHNKQASNQRQAFLETEEHRVLFEGTFAPNTRLLESVQEAKGTSKSSSTACKLPPAASKSCQATNYAILAVVPDNSIVSEGGEDASQPVVEQRQDSENTWQRRLFLNCLKWMADAAASPIFIFLPLAAKEMLQENESYGQRLWRWHTQPDHPVRLVFGQTFWDALSEFVRDTELLGDSKPAAVLWTSGDRHFPGNQAGFRQGFDQWKSQSAAMVSSTAWQFQYRPDSMNRDTSKLNLRRSDHVPPLAPLPMLRRINATAARSMSRDRDSLERRFPVLVDLSVATFHDWNYLCFLQHPALAPLRELSTDDWNTARFAAAAWLSLVTPGDREQRKKDAASAIVLTMLQDIRFFDHFVQPNEEASHPAVEDSSPLSDVPLDEGMLEVLSMFGGLPSVPDEKHIPVSFRRDLTFC